MSDCTNMTKNQDNAASNKEILLDIRHLKKYFNVSGGLLHAVDDVSLTIPRGKTLGLVGESGCGKSTLGRVVIGLIEATGGEVFFNGEDSLKFNGEKRAQFRRNAQIVFQDPFSSLNPRMSVSQLISEPLIINKACANRHELDKKVASLMDIVGLASRLTTSFPHELDGGRRQRIGIARALALDPQFIVLDEPVSALDVCIQAQVLNLLADLQEQFHLTYLFITHNLAVVRHLADQVGVMFLGRAVEVGAAEDVFAAPLHPYTKFLIGAVPLPDPRQRDREKLLLQGDIPSPMDLPPGCRFSTRCPYVRERCREEDPPTLERGGRSVACHYPLEW